MIPLRGLHILLVYLCVVHGAELPSAFKKCKLTADSQTLSACLMDSINSVLPKLEKGFPELGIQSCQPMKIKKFTVGEGAGVVHVVQNFKDAGFHNMIYMKMNKLSASYVDKELKIKAEGYTDHIKLQGTYNLNGSILVFPIYGNGRATIDLYDVKLPLFIKGVTTQNKGETYLKFEDFKLEVRPKKVAYNFENLFDGNKALGDNINKILNDNSLEVYGDVQKGYDNVVSGLWKDVANTIAAKVPLNKLFLA